MPYNVFFPVTSTLTTEQSVEELFKKLSYDELSNLAIAIDSSGTIKKEKQNQVVQFLNEGLKRLHIRFSLAQTAQLFVFTRADLGNGTEVVEPLAPDLLQVLSILTATGESIPFHTQPVPGSVYVYNRELYLPVALLESLMNPGLNLLPTMQPSILGQTLDAGDMALQVTYQRRHPVLQDIVEPADLGQVVTLVPELFDALTAWVGHRMYGNMRTPEAAAASADCLQRYKQTCREVEDSGVLPSEALPDQKFETRGFV